VAIHLRLRKVAVERVLTLFMPSFSVSSQNVALP